MLLNITALTKTYTISGKLIIALNTVDLTFSENSFTCIVGKSGCGKMGNASCCAGEAAAVKQHY